MPPQPARFFRLILERLSDEPRAVLYIAEHEARAIGALMVIHFRDKTYVKYEGLDYDARDKRTVYALFWRSIQDACAAGHHTCDFGRTARSNPGLGSFKKRWGADPVALPYYFAPAGSGGVSVADDSSFKYRVLTSTFRRLPIGLSAWLGARIFRHFG